MPIDASTIAAYAGAGMSLLFGLLLGMAKWTFKRELQISERQIERLESRIERLKELQDARTPILASKVDRAELAPLASSKDVDRLDVRLRGIEEKLDKALLKLVKNE